MSKKLSGAQNRKRKLNQSKENEFSARLMSSFFKKKCEPNMQNEERKNTEGEKYVEIDTNTFEEEEEERDDNQAKNVNTDDKSSSEDSENDASVTLQQELIVDSRNTEVSNYSDPALWPSEMTNLIRDLIIVQDPILPQGPDSRFPLNNEKRHFTIKYCHRILSNGEVSQRRWLLYSESADKVFCLCCKLFNPLSSSKLSSEGINNWKHMSEYLKSHESSTDHFKTCKMWLLAASNIRKVCGIDKQLQEQVIKEQNYWRAVLERLMSISLFLSKNNLGFRGTSDRLMSNNNGNFLGLVELLSQYDPIMGEHMKRVRNQEIHNHYCGKDIQNELINLLGDQVKTTIIHRAQQAKYFSLICDCTPDISHTDQLSITIRFVDLNDMSLKEHFLTYCEAPVSTGEALSDIILEEMNRCNFDMNNCRGQGYDNGSNMVGKNKGVRSRISKLYPRAFFNPCGCHSLNLIVGDAAKCSVKSVSLFGVLQRLYVLFSASTKRWAILKTHVTNLTIKQVCETRWECRIQCVKAIRYQFKEICNALCDMAEKAEDIKISSDAKSLELFFTDYSFIVALIVWYDVLFQVNLISKMMQSKNLDIADSITLIEGCAKFLNEYRNTGFESAQAIAREIAEQLEIEPIFKVQRLRKKKTLFDYEGKDDGQKSLDMLFKTDVFLPLIDTAISAIDDRFETLQYYTNMWSFLHNIKILPTREDLVKKCMDLHLYLKDGESCDINGSELSEELIHIQSYFASLPDFKDAIKITPGQLLKFIHDQNLDDIFPNIWISMRILLIIPVTVASGERSFSKLKLIKNYLRSTMLQERLKSFAILSIEQDMIQKVNLTEALNKFAAVKARKKFL